MGQCKNHMKVRRINDLCPAFVHPDFLLYGLTVWTAAVTAGIVMEFHVPTVRTLAQVDAELPRFTV